MKKVLITGGQGDIAQAITKKLLYEGGYDIKTPGKEELDVTNVEMVEQFVKNFVPDILINNAGYVCPPVINTFFIIFTPLCRKHA